MLSNKLYFQKSKKKTDDGKYEFEIEFDPDHEIFKGHFPGNPILPGVCTVQIIKELMEDIENHPLKMTKANMIKYLSFINPQLNKTVFISVQNRKAENDIVSCNSTVYSGPVSFCSFKGEFISESDEREMVKIDPVLQGENLSDMVKVLNESHGTVAEEFGFTRETNPSNSAFIDIIGLNEVMKKGVQLFKLVVDNMPAGCIGIEKSSKEEATFYIEKVSVIPAFRNKGFGVLLMNFATEEIKKSGGKTISIALINENTKLKNWYINLGFIETAIKKFPHLPFTVCFMNKVVG